MVHWWYGILGIHLSNNPFHKGIPNIQTTNYQTTNWPFYSGWKKSHSQPPEMYKTLKNIGYLPYQLVIAGFFGTINSSMSFRFRQKVRKIHHVNWCNRFLKHQQLHLQYLVVILANHQVNDKQTKQCTPIFVGLLSPWLRKTCHLLTGIYDLWATPLEGNSFPCDHRGCCPRWKFMTQIELHKAMLRTERRWAKESRERKSEPRVTKTVETRP